MGCKTRTNCLRASTARSGKLLATGGYWPPHIAGTRQWISREYCRHLVPEKARPAGDCQESTGVRTLLLSFAVSLYRPLLRKFQSQPANEKNTLNRLHFHRASRKGGLEVERQ
jgi:hypothetical protein